MKRLDKERIEPEFNKASNLWKEGKAGAAIKVFRRLDKEYPDQPAILGMLGAIFFSQNKTIALGYFEKIVKLAPKSEIASRGLFHCLWAHRRHDEALDEMRRYIRLNGYSKEYALTIEELDENGFFQAEFMPPASETSKKTLTN